MKDKIKAKVAKFIPNDEVRLNPANLEENDFHYGKLEDVELFNGEPATVIKSEFDRHTGEMSYLVHFEEVSGKFWFLESEIH
jgi:hypothetical protein